MHELLLTLQLILIPDRERRATVDPVVTAVSLDILAQLVIQDHLALTVTMVDLEHLETREERDQLELLELL